MSLEANVKARRAAEEIAELVDQEAKIHGNRFWEELLRIIQKRLGINESEKALRAKKMNDSLARQFGQELMPFGEFSGRPIDDVPIERLEWYADQTFVDDLRGYLESDRVKQERSQDDG